MAGHFIGVPIGNAGLPTRAPTRPPSIYGISATVEEIIADFGYRLRDVTWQVQGTVQSNNIMSTIALSNEAILIASDKIGVAGEVTFLDWMRDVNGVTTGEVDPSITRIRGGVIQTGQIMSRDAHACIDLDAMGDMAFIKSKDGVLINSDGTFMMGNPTTGKSLVWDGEDLFISENSTVAGVPLKDVVDSAMTALSETRLADGSMKILSQVTGTAGNVYSLNTLGDTGAILIAHKDINYGAAGGAGQGYAPLGGYYRAGIAITAGGIAMGYNRPSDGRWVNSVLIGSDGNATFTGTVAAGSVISGNATVDGATLGSVAANANYGASRTVGDITANVLANSATSVEMTSSALFKATNGAGGLFIGAGGITAKNSTGTTTFAISAMTGAASFVGDISGGSSLNITGSARFQGVTTTGHTENATVVGIGSGSTSGVHGTSGHGSGVVGVALGQAGNGVSGFGSIYGVSGSGGQAGVYGSSSTIGVYGRTNSVGGVGVRGQSADMTSGAGVHCVGNFRWGGISDWQTWSPPDGSGKFLKDDGTWAIPSGGGSSFTPVQQGGGAGQLNNKICIGWSGSSNLLLQVDGSNFGSTWPINVNGNAAYATSAGSASSASNASRLEGYSAQDIVNAINNAIANNNSGNIRRYGTSFTLTIPGLGQWSGCTVA